MRFWSAGYAGSPLPVWRRQHLWHRLRWSLRARQSPLRCIRRRCSRQSPRRKPLSVGIWLASESIQLPLRRARTVGRRSRGRSPWRTSDIARAVVLRTRRAAPICQPVGRTSAPPAGPGDWVAMAVSRSAATRDAADLLRPDLRCGADGIELYPRRIGQGGPWARCSSTRGRFACLVRGAASCRWSPAATRDGDALRWPAGCPRGRR